ncbi:ATP-binding protein [Streptomyces sp. NPDC126933]|uniref:ATP-binding protein n=1 Tax=unclassified Streptomyces TaxID=2593676 RepID=UPI0036632F62
MRAAHALMSFDADPRHVENVRRVTKAVLGKADIRDRDTVGTAQLLVSEIVTNAIVHGNANTVSFQPTCDTDGRVLIEVDDHSSGSPEVREAEPDDEGGRGMQLVTFLADD